jgi:hypothetical protein
MPRRETLKRGRLVPFRLVPIVLAGGIGYVIGGLDTTALRSTDDQSAAQMISLRFPAQWSNPSPAPTAGPAALTAAMNASAANAASQAQLALLNPEPMVPQAVVPQAVDPQAVPPQASVPQTSTSQTSTSQALVPPAIARPAPPVAAAGPPAVASSAPSETAAAAIAARRRIANRPGYMLDDAQIASIKGRLNLTPDQEQMWPAVEAALRDMHYTHLQEAHARGIAAGNQPVAAVDPNTVQGLKSAAVPLIMSFNAEQKEEVRNIVHVMGLDELAQQF